MPRLRRSERSANHDHEQALRRRRTGAACSERSPGAALRFWRAVGVALAAGAAASCNNPGLIRDQPLAGAKYLAFCDTARALAVQTGAVAADVQRDPADIPRTLRAQGTNIACPLTTPMGGHIRLLARAVCSQWERETCVRLVQVERGQS